MVGEAGLEPAVPEGVGFTVRWGYQFSYSPIYNYNVGIPSFIPYYPKGVIVDILKASWGDGHYHALIPRIQPFISVVFVCPDINNLQDRFPYPILASKLIATVDSFGNFISLKLR